MAVAFHWEPWRRHAAKGRRGRAAKSPAGKTARSQHQDRLELSIGIVTLALAVLAGLALPWL